MAFVSDHQIRTALRRILEVHYSRDPETLVVEELGLRHGATRVDVVVINGILHGFELKSDYDTLKRLPNQAGIYNSVLDRVTLVVGCRHIEEAMRIVPDWWGIQLVEMDLKGTIQFSEVRKPHDNPSTDILSVIKLLWRDEALSLLDELDTTNGLRSKPRKIIYARLAKVANPELLRARVCQQLQRRIGWRSGAPQMSCGD